MITQERVEKAVNCPAMWMLAVFVVSFFLPLVEIGVRTLSGPGLVELIEDNVVLFKRTEEIRASQRGATHMAFSPPGLEYVGYLLYVFPLVAIGVVRRAFQGRITRARAEAIGLGILSLVTAGLSALVASDEHAHLKIGFFVFAASSVGLILKNGTLRAFALTDEGSAPEQRPQSSGLRLPKMQLSSPQLSGVSRLLPLGIVGSIFLPWLHVNQMRASSLTGLIEQSMQYRKMVGQWSSMLPGYSPSLVMMVVGVVVGASVLLLFLANSSHRRTAAGTMVVAVAALLHMMEAMRAEEAQILGMAPHYISTGIGYYLAIAVAACVAVKEFFLSARSMERPALPTGPVTEVVERHDAKMPGDAVAGLMQPLGHKAVKLAQGFDTKMVMNESKHSISQARSYLQAKGEQSFLLGALVGFLASTNPMLLLVAVGGGIAYVVVRAQRNRAALEAMPKEDLQEPSLVENPQDAPPQEEHAPH